MSSAISFDALSIKVPELLSKALATLRLYPALDAVGACAVVWAILRWRRLSRERLRTTQLRGPPSESFVYGVGDKVFDADHPGDVYEAWAREYGPVYEVPSTLGGKRVVLCDPKAIAHFYAKETWTYVQTPMTQKILEDVIGKGLLWAHGTSHKRHVHKLLAGKETVDQYIDTRQRKSLTPAFSNAAIRQMASIFYDEAYKVKGAWDALIESGSRNDAVIDVQDWMNHISLDTIGLAGFSHNFGALEGKRASVAEVFDIFGASPGSAKNKLVLLLSEKLPFLVRLPTSRTQLFRHLNTAMEEISNGLLAKTQKELEMGVVGEKGDKSVIGLLIKGANGVSEFSLTKEEVMAQMKVLLIAGYETTSVSLTWALLELSRNPDVQTRLRDELLEHGADPTYDQFNSDLPYLDAVVHEILRLHPPVVEITRVAVEDDVIPLSEPVRTKSGELVDSLTIAKGTLVTISMESTNRSTTLWGDDAKAFRPNRWLEDAASGQSGIPAKAKEVQGHRHLLTFADGPKTCLGKGFALIEVKAVLTVLIKNFVFELRDSADAVVLGRGMLPRPRIASEAGCKLPLRVRPYVA